MGCAWLKWQQNPLFQLLRILKQFIIKGYKVFNTGILPIDDGYLFVSRRSGKNLWEALKNKYRDEYTKDLYIGELDKKYFLKNTPRAVFKSKDKDWLFIDARLFRVGNDVYMVYCRQYKHHKIKREAGLYLSKLEKKEGCWQPVTNIKLKYDFVAEFYEKNLVTENFEKNWMPFSSKGRLYFVYLIEPEHVILEANIQTGACEVVARTKNNFSKNLFSLRGSTPAVLDKELGEWITLYHYVLPSFRRITGKPRNAYFIGGYTFSEKKPFNILRKSIGPLVGKNFYKKKKNYFSYGSYSR